MKELNFIQVKLNAPKNKRNQFGKYDYRSCEDILEAVKPLLADQECTLTLNDEIVEICGRLFVRATARVTNKEGVSEDVNAYAEIPDSQAGMTAAQLTGSTSSYARKYALNGLLAIDDNKDPDDLNIGEEKKTSKNVRKADKTTSESVEKVTRKAEKIAEMEPQIAEKKSRKASEKVDANPGTSILDAYEAINKAKSYEDLCTVWSTYRNIPGIGDDPNFRTAFTMHPAYVEHNKNKNKK